MTAMDLIHDSIRGIHMLHWLTVAVPLATLLVTFGVLPSKTTARVLLLGVVMTFATGLLSSTAAGISQVRYGAPLAMATEGIEPLTGQLRMTLTILRACFVANLLFWCSTSVFIAALLQGLARRLRWARGAGSRP